MVATFVIVEMAEDCNEGLVYGLLTTMGNLGQVRWPATPRHPGDCTALCPCLPCLSLPPTQRSHDRDVCSQAIPQALSNQLFGSFSPSLSDPANYLAAKGGDQPCFRRVVALSFGIGYAFAFASLLTLPLLPDQKAQAQYRKRAWAEHTGYAVATVVLVTVAMAYTVRAPPLPLTHGAFLR